MIKISLIKPRLFKTSAQISLSLLLLAGAILVGIVGTPNKAFATNGDSCSTVPASNYGTDTTTISAPSTATYNIWIRMEVLSTAQVPADGDSVFLNINGTCFNAGGLQTDTTNNTNLFPSTNTWYWVNFYDGSTNSSSGVTTKTPMTAALTQGSNPVVITGSVGNIAVDRIEALNSGCTPTGSGEGSGDNCTPALPTVAVTAPTNGTNITSGSTTLQSSVTGGTNFSFTGVKYQYQSGSTCNPGAGTNVTGTSGTSSPYSLTWNTSGLPNGPYSLIATVTDSNGNSSDSSGTCVTVNVDNPPTNTVLPLITGTAAIGDTLTVSDGTWNNSPTSYAIQWKHCNSGTCTNIGTNSTTYVIGSGDIGDTIEAIVTATNGGGSTPATAAATGVVQGTPTPPTSLVATPSSSAVQITLTWTEPSSADPVSSFNIFRCTASSGSGCSNFGTSATYNISAATSGSSPYCSTSGSGLSCSYTDTQLASSTTYSYEITSLDSLNTPSAPSNVAHATTMTVSPSCTTNPNSPTGFSGTPSELSVSFSWVGQGVGSGCQLGGYHVFEVYPNTNNPVTTEPDVTNGSSDTFSGLLPNHSYSYVVTAFDTSGHTSSPTPTSATTPSITLTTTADTTPPAWPNNPALTGTATSSQVSLTWPAATDAYSTVTGYSVYRCKATGSGSPCTISNTAQPYASVTSPGFQDNSVLASSYYTYEVAANDQAGNQSSRLVISPTNPIGTPAASGTVPLAPTGLVANPIATQSATLNWSAPSSGSAPTSYNIYLNGVYLANSSNTTYSDACYAPNVAYTFTVKSVDSAGSSTSSASTSFTSPSGGLPGDVECLGTVNSVDFFQLLRYWGSMGDALPTQGDVNGDTNVNSIDFFQLLRYWGLSS